VAALTGGDPSRRTELALPRPPGSVKVPTATRSATRGPWVRAHHPEFGAWYFASVPDRTTSGGRFDLPAPRGTCYIASDARVAVRERFGPLAAGRPLSAAMLGTTSISTVTPTPEHRRSVADTTHPDAAESITGEIWTTVSYGRTQEWAQHWDTTEGRTGILYLPRFSTDPRQRSFAVFGPAGPDESLRADTAVPATDLLGPGVAAVSRRAAEVIDT
jgi:hypothetical protein